MKSTSWKNNNLLRRVREERAEKYYGYFTDNYNTAMRGSVPEEENVTRKVKFKSLEDLYKYAILLYFEYDSWDEEMKEDFGDLPEEDADFSELKSFYEDNLDESFGAPYLYYIEDSNGQKVWASDAYYGDPSIGLPELNLSGEELSLNDGRFINPDIPCKVVEVFYSVNPIDDEWDDDEDF